MDALTTIVEKQPSEGNDAFHCLVQDLSRTLGPSSGLDSTDVDPQDLQRLMEGYTSIESDWLQYALGDSGQAYTRNLVDKGNGKSNLLILVWTPGKGSPIHDHANAHCVMKILKGSLKETLYDWPANGITLNGQSSPLSPKKETVYLENDVSYMSDKIGLHKICNPDTRGVAVSLHLYTPPHAVKFGFNWFEESTGRANHIQHGQYYSELGYRL